MFRRFIRFVLCLVGVAVLGGAVFYLVTAPNPLPESHWANLGAPDVKNGEMVFWAGGCVSCHAAPSAEGDAKLTLSGGLALKSPFGTFHVPNISSDEQAGIGNWTLAQFGNAMKRGVAPNGSHLYPSFPYASYTRMTDKDVNDLYAYMKTLPKSSNVAPPHELPLLQNADDKVKRGQYLVEGLGHCGECHTPRDALGGLKPDLWLAGAPNPEGQGTIPNITPGSKAIGEWSEADIANYLETGFTPDFDSAGGSMTEVQQNVAHLPKADLEAIAAYLKAVPGH
jgi:mono/diheme cytochrome c family protein